MPTAWGLPRENIHESSISVSRPAPGGGRLRENARETSVSVSQPDSCEGKPCELINTSPESQLAELEMPNSNHPGKTSNSLSPQKRSGRKMRPDLFEMPGSKQPSEAYLYGFQHVMEHGFPNETIPNASATNEGCHSDIHNPLAAAAQPDAVLAALKNLGEKYPFVNLHQIGTSRLGNSIHCLTIGTGEKEIMINAAHHANEWITTPILLQFMEDYAANHNPNITLHCIPLVNPDGVALVTGGIPPSSPAYKAAEEMTKNHPVQLPQPLPDSWKANIIGVDLNSNYPANWHLAKQHKFAKGYTQPGPRDYVGPQPLSEPESCAMVAYTKINDFALTISLHTQGEEIYWQYMDYDPPGAKELAIRMSKASGYILEEVPDSSSHGGYRDWFIQAYNRPGFTIECGLGESPLPPEDFDGIYKKVAPLLWEAVL